MVNTVWDQIYKDYQKGGQAWATLEGGLEKHFKDFVERTDFSKKWAFDIGYGTGQYLQYLKLRGFKVFGIDSSPTAQEMAEKSLGQNLGLLCGDMYEHEFPANSYGLILSISTIHHGTKDKVKKVLERVYKGLVDGGYAYITLPINDSSNEWMTFKDKDEIEPGTYAPNSGPEKGLPHSFYKRDEAENLFTNYKKVSIDTVNGRWHIVAQK